MSGTGLLFPTEMLRESEEAAAELELGRTNDPLLISEHAKKKRTRTSLAGLATAIAAGIFGGASVSWCAVYFK